MEAGIRNRVEIWADGGYRHAHDIVKLHCLGANRVAFGTLAMVSLGCTICRGCQLDTCHVGIATQIETVEQAQEHGLKKFTPQNVDGAAESCARFFGEMGEEVKEVVASLGFERAQDLVGRYDLLEHQQEYFEVLLAHHVGGLLKVAPESVCEAVTQVMRKPGPQLFETFLRRFREASGQLGLRQGVVPYFISAHPGCTVSDMVDVALFLQRHHLRVEQVQEFTPTPGTLSTCIYFTGRDPITRARLHVPRSAEEKRLETADFLDEDAVTWKISRPRHPPKKALGSPPPPIPSSAGHPQSGRAPRPAVKSRPPLAAVSVRGL